MTHLSGLPQSNEDYGSREYWDHRYKKESENESFDWFKSYQDIAPFIRELIPNKSSKILMLGCGNSKLSQEMWDDGYKNIVNVDYSSVVIDQMKRKHETTRPEMQWYEADIRQLPFEVESFDIVMDKGTMDAMMTAKGDVWDPPQQVIDDCTREVDEALRVLRKPDGMFLYLTFGQPHFRRRYLTRPNTKLEIQQIGESFHYYFYILRCQSSSSSG